VTSTVTDAVVVGAGPYGLSVAAQAREAGLRVRVFGKPMGAWAESMPVGMFLKSEPWASDLADSARRFTLQAFCAQHGEPYGHGQPVPVERFVAYGRWFQERTGVEVDQVDVVRVARQGDEFLVELSSGATLRTRSVVLAVGVVPFAFTPPELEVLPEHLGGHCSRFHDLSELRGRDVTVVGAGQSAIETAALLVENGARPRLVARANQLVWNELPPPLRRPLARRLRSPQSGLGIGWSNWTYAERPQVVRHFSAAKRTALVHSALGPAGSWWLRERFVDRVPTQLGVTVSRAVGAGDAVTLTLAGRDGSFSTIETERVIAATGYQPDVNRLELLDASLRQSLRLVGRSPRLSPHFESSVPGLYFVGLMATLSFGPVQRFVYGTRFAAQRVSAHLSGRGRVRRAADSSVDQSAAASASVD
jgi:thioredoxin reductase